MYGLYEHKRSFGATWVELAGAHERVIRPRRYALGRGLARAARLARGRRRSPMTTIAELLAAAEPREPRPLAELAARLRAAGRLRAAIARGRARGRVSARRDRRLARGPAGRGLRRDPRGPCRRAPVRSRPPALPVRSRRSSSARSTGRRILVQLVVDRSQLALADAAAWWYGDPSRDLGVVGITGTDGKTSTAFLAAAALAAAGVPAGLVGTIATGIGGRPRDEHRPRHDPGRAGAAGDPPGDGRCRRSGRRRRDDLARPRRRARSRDRLRRRDPDQPVPRAPRVPRVVRGLPGGQGLALRAARDGAGEPREAGGRLAADRDRQRGRPRGRPLRGRDAAPPARGSSRTAAPRRADVRLLDATEVDGRLRVAYATADGRADAQPSARRAVQRPQRPRRGGARRARSAWTPPPSAPGWRASPPCPAGWNGSRPDSRSASSSTTPTARRPSTLVLDELGPGRSGGRRRAHRRLRVGRGARRRQATDDGPDRRGAVPARRRHGRGSPWRGS